MWKGIRRKNRKLVTKQIKFTSNPNKEWMQTKRGERRMNFMEAKRINVTNGMFLGSMRHMLDRGEITLEQYAESLRRAKGDFQ